MSVISFDARPVTAKTGDGSEGLDHVFLELSQFTSCVAADCSDAPLCVLHHAEQPMPSELRKYKTA